MSTSTSRVAVIGASALPNPGTTHPDLSFKQMLVRVAYEAIADAGIDPRQIQGTSYSYTGEGEVGFGSPAPTFNDALGLSAIPGFINSSNCASGHSAFMQGCDMVQTGRCDIALVAGFDKSTDVMAFFDYALTSSDSLYDYNLGFSHIDAVLLQGAYFETFGIDADRRREVLSYYGEFARRTGAQHPWAHQYHQSVPTRKMLEAMPLHGSLMQTGEGAAAMILATEEIATALCSRPVFVPGRSYLTTSQYVGHRYHPQLLQGAPADAVGGASDGLPLRLACEAAYTEAGITAADIDTIGVYDQVTTELVSLEAAGICGPGEAVDWLLAGEGEINGSVPTNTDGGNIGRGFAGGTAGLYPLIEIVSQLRGKPRGAQIPKPIRHGLSTFIGGGFAHNVAVVMTNQ